MSTPKTKVTITEEWESSDEDEEGESSEVDSFYSEEEIDIEEENDPFEDICEDASEEEEDDSSSSPLRSTRSSTAGRPAASPARTSSTSTTQAALPSPVPKTPRSLPSREKPPSSVRRRSGGIAGRRRSVAEHSAPPGLRWHAPEEEDAAHRLPNFCPRVPPGVRFPETDRPSPLQLFRKFFTDEDVETVCENTNKNAAKNLARGKTYQWRDITPADFFAYVGLLLFMAVLKMPRTASYWRRGSVFGASFPATIMTRSRFQAISWNIHMSDPEKDAVNDGKKGAAEYDPLHRVKPLYDSLRERCRACWQPRQQVFIDERMGAATAKTRLPWAMKAKPNKWGVKLFVLTDSSNGYTSDFTVYTGKSLFPEGRALSYEAAMELMNERHLGSGYHLYCDHFFTGPKLFADLYERRKFLACGAYRGGRTGVPTTKANALTAKSPRGSMRWFRKGKLLYVKWMDAAEVSVCSTIHAAFKGDAVERNMKDKATGKWERRRVPVPAPVAAYNTHMEGLDLSQRLLQVFSVRKNTDRWYRTLFYHFVDIATANAYILHREQCARREENPTSPLDFLEHLTAELCGVKPGNRTKPTGNLECAPVTIAQTSDKSMKASAGRLRCINCGSKTPWKCRFCGVPLCLIPDRNCFVDWHDFILSKQENTNGHLAGH
ncbi:piggyBac transposable element-derived protein 4-like [Centroberyx affinis]|uniref:piggyBac transposable element-derived protein 4-like n=1 Tax=Centroberyx affinis TaxID=166261 RepID=UPI003A5C16D0